MGGRIRVHLSANKRILLYQGLPLDDARCRRGNGKVADALYRLRSGGPDCRLLNRKIRLIRQNMKQQTGFQKSGEILNAVDGALNDEEHL